MRHQIIISLEATKNKVLFGVLGIAIWEIQDSDKTKRMFQEREGVGDL